MDQFRLEALDTAFSYCISCIERISWRPMDTYYSCVLEYKHSHRSGNFSVHNALCCEQTIINNWTHICCKCSRMTSICYMNIIFLFILLYGEILLSYHQIQNILTYSKRIYDTFFRKPTVYQRNYFESLNFYMLSR